ncbi:zinc-ribbon domain-containing protein [Demequina capsici]|uniref:Zinc-ribbon domain-containing protein n=1 Tax=Demequina capsici TaxID=3075620 RepID=A0AA96F744_9MICO|nr:MULTISPECIES: zinc-ribbon domain-containing protein [unclassified Demequina]WNM24514.1 zinc-ribbon domain-containing protein [Demequina sp. OYTSA14]WNM27366.1 zinc-ribbon domain-containing protein [Demequina sp. PMTSA13]
MGIFTRPSLATRWPDLAKEFDLERNAPLTADDVSARSMKRVWWTSPTCGHSWQDSPRGRTGQTPRDCQVCGGGGSGFVPREPGAEASLNPGLRGGPIVP